MIAHRLWPLLLMTGAVQAATLPLKAGTYVLTGVPCDEPPFAAMFDYDGNRFSYPHASKCRSTIVSRHGRVYRVREQCAALGDGSPTAPFTTVTNYKIVSQTRVALLRADEKRDPVSRVYRRCSPIQSSRGS